MSSIGRNVCIVSTLFLLALPAASETFTVTLMNGNTFISRYKPLDAPFDATQVTFLTDMGNWIALPKSDIASIMSETESRGFGYVIDTTTIILGWAPNDGLTPEEAAEAAANAAEQERFAPPPSYTAPLFSEPSAAGGIPLNFLGTTTPPLGFPAGSGIEP